LPYAGWDFADVADDADFSSLLFVCPTDFHRSLPYAGWDFADDTDDADFFLQLIYHPSRFSGRNRVSC